MNVQLKKFDMQSIDPDKVVIFIGKRQTGKCLNFLTEVRMKNGSKKAIGDIKIGEEVETFDPISKKMSYSKVVNQYVEKTEKKIFRLENFSNRSIDATFDHKFMTYDGWKQVDEIDIENDLLGVEGNIEILNDNNYKEKIILDEVKFIKNLINYLDEELINEYVIELKKIDLLNLRTDNKKLYRLMRILGFVMDKNSLIYKNKKFILDIIFNDDYDIEMFELDMKELGFKNISYNKKNNNFENSSIFCSLLKVLFLDLEWINDLSDMCKREFLSGFIGSNINKYDENKIIILNNENILIKDLFKYFKIKYNIHHNKLFIDDNIINFYEKIGFRYNRLVHTKMGLIIEYLKSTKNNLSNLNDWINKCKIICNSLFIPIKSITEIENCLISDITTESSNHSFYANDFLVHNSFLVKDLLYYHRHIPVGTVISGTESANCFYGNIVPSVFIHDEYSAPVIKNVVKRQKIIKRQMNYELHNDGHTDINPNAFLILDDCLDDNSWIKDKNIKTCFMNGRHWHILFIITMQFALGVPPNLRTNVDYVFILRENIVSNRKRIYEHYAGMFPTFDTFQQVMDQCTENYECLVINNNSKSNKLEDQVFWYKANPHPPFRIGSDAIWRHHQLNFDPHHDSDDDGEIPRKRSSGPKINVKKVKKFI